MEHYIVDRLSLCGNVCITGVVHVILITSQLLPSSV